MIHKLVIFGVGLIGGSAALALKKVSSATHIVGVGRNPESLNDALRLGIIDSAETNTHTACSDADVILIAAPVAQTKAILQSIQPHLNTKTIITDAGSTKSDVLAVAKEVLGAQFGQFVGAHPIAGAEKTGPAAAKADLFVGKNVIVTPTPEANPDAASRASAFWQKCGAKVSQMSAQEHDAVFAAVSHLPHLLAFALVNEIANRPNAAQLFGFAASGFRDFTRIAGSSPEMWRDISLANRDALLNELTAFEQQISQLKKMLQDADTTGLQDMFEHASKARNDWGKTQ